MAIPQVSECQVELLPDGTYKLTHNRTQDTAVAHDHEHLEIEGAILRASAALNDIRVIARELH